MASSPDPTPSRYSRLQRFGWWAPLLGGASVGIVMRLVYSGRPQHAFDAMMSSFVLLVPVLVGAVAVLIAERGKNRSGVYHFWTGAAANALFVLGTLAILIEGLICAILAVPLFGILGGIAGVLMGIVCRRTIWAKQTVFCLAALPLVLGGIEQHWPLPQDTSVIERTRLVAAPPEAVKKPGPG